MGKTDNVYLMADNGEEVFKIDREHYISDDNIEPIDLILAGDLKFCEGNILKYAYRAGKKDSETIYKDLIKCIDYSAISITNNLKKEENNNVAIDKLEKEIIDKIKFRFDNIKKN